MISVIRLLILMCGMLLTKKPCAVLPLSPNPWLLCLEPYIPRDSNNIP